MLDLSRNMVAIEPVREVEERGFDRHVFFSREQHNRKTHRYQSDLRDEEWRVIEPHLLAARGTGRPRTWSMREIVNGIFYVMRAGRPWRLLPSDFPPWETVYRWFAVWRDDGRLPDAGEAALWWRTFQNESRCSDRTPSNCHETHRWTSTGILECVSTLTVSLPRTIAEMPWRPCEAMTIRSQPFDSAVSMIAR